MNNRTFLVINIFCFLLILSTILIPSSEDNTEDKIINLLWKLQKTDCANRAELELFKIGCPAKPLLEKHLKKAKGDAKKRITRLLDDLTWAYGKEVDGILAGIRLGKTEYKLNEPIKFEICIKNISLDSREIMKKMQNTYNTYFCPNMGKVQFDYIVDGKVNPKLSKVWPGLISAGGSSRDDDDPMFKPHRVYSKLKPFEKWYDMYTCNTQQLKSLDLRPGLIKVYLKGKIVLRENEGKGKNLTKDKLHHHSDCIPIPYLYPESKAVRITIRPTQINSD